MCVHVHIQNTPFQKQPGCFKYYYWIRLFLNSIQSIVYITQTNVICGGRMSTTSTVQDISIINLIQSIINFIHILKIHAHLIRLPLYLKFNSICYLFYLIKYLATGLKTKIIFLHNMVMWLKPIPYIVEDNVNLTRCEDLYHQQFC